MRFPQFCVAIALVIGALGCGAANAAIRDLAPPGASRTMSQSAPDPGSAAGGEGRWARRIKHIAEVAACALDGAAAARVFIVGVSGVGGVVATAVIAVAALACMGS